jgi:hypothetical protein
MAATIQMEGLRFGKLIVTSRRMDGGRRAAWNCKCDCGSTRVVIGEYLRRGSVHDCGCVNPPRAGRNKAELTGKTFSHLHVLKEAPKSTKTRGRKWICKCDCGKVVELSSNAITSGNNRSCGGEAHRQGGALETRRKAIGELPLAHVNQIRQNAIKRNLRFNVTAEYLWDLFQEQDRKCALTGTDLSFTTARNPSATRGQTTASLDRIDSSVGYEVGNVRWLHKTVNKMRSNMSDQEFIEWCSLVVKGKL